MCFFFFFFKDSIKLPYCQLLTISTPLRSALLTHVNPCQPESECSLYQAGLPSLTGLMAGACFQRGWECPQASFQFSRRGGFWFGFRSVLASWPDHAPLCFALGDFSVGLFPQESEISEHVKELHFSDSAASDPKSFLGLVSLR